MTHFIRQRIAYSFLVTCIVGIAACADKPGGSTFTSGQGGSTGSGGEGQAGSGPGPIIGGNGGAGNTDGGFPPRACPMQPDPPCPAKVHMGDARAVTIGAVNMFEGITEIKGALTLGAIQDLEALACLERVVGDLEIDLHGEGTMSLYGLRNLKFVGGNVDIYSSSRSLELRTDCALGRLESVGTTNLLGGYVAASATLSGGLDLSRLRTVTHVRISTTRLTRITLPSNVNLTMGQLFFEGNTLLSEVLGFENVNLMRRDVASGAYNLRITNNGLLPTCRAEQFHDMFIAAGFDPNLMTVSGNGPCFR